MVKNYQFSNAVCNFFTTATSRISWSKQPKIKTNDFLNATTMQNLKKAANNNSNFDLVQNYFSIRKLL